MEAITPRTSPVPELFDRTQSRDSVVTLRVRHPLTLVEAIDVQRKVRALIARHPNAIVLDVAGLIPTGEMGVLMLPSMAHDAAEEGVTVVLANPSRPLHDRLAQLGVRSLTFVYRPAPTEPSEDGWDGETDGTLDLLPPPGPEAQPALRRSGMQAAHAAAGIYHLTLPSALRPCGTLPTQT